MLISIAAAALGMCGRAGPGWMLEPGSLLQTSEGRVWESMHRAQVPGLRAHYWRLTRSGWGVPDMTHKQPDMLETMDLAGMESSLAAGFRNLILLRNPKSEIHWW